MKEREERLTFSSMAHASSNIRGLSRERVLFSGAEKDKKNNFPAEIKGFERREAEGDRQTKEEEKGK